MAEDMILRMDDDSDLVLMQDNDINLGEDTVTRDVVLTGYTFHLPSGEQATGECTYDCDSSNATAVADDIMQDKTAYVNGQEIVGTYKLSEHTSGSATAKDIKSGKTAWVRGAKLTGTYTPMCRIDSKSNPTNVIIQIPNGTYIRNQTITLGYSSAVNLFINSISSTPQTMYIRRFSQSGTIVCPCAFAGYNNTLRQLAVIPASNVTATDSDYYLSIATLPGSTYAATYI